MPMEAPSHPARLSPGKKLQFGKLYLQIAARWLIMVSGKHKRELDDWVQQNNRCPPKNENFTDFESSEASKFMQSGSLSQILHFNVCPTSLKC